jgi:protein phosphatase
MGRVYQQNDDYVWVDDAVGLYIVADGMGGHESGNVASQMTATTVGPMVIEHLQAETPPYSPELVKTALTAAIESANAAVFQAATEAEQKRKMGTTIVVTLIAGSHVFISHAGDSRAYLARAGQLQQLTEDDSWGAQFAAAGKKTEGERGRFDHFLTKSIGQESPIHPSFREFSVEPGDWLLLCSDGLWNMVSDEQILTELQRPEVTPHHVAETLVSAANAAGGKDNISVIAIKILP